MALEAIPSIRITERSPVKLVSLYRSPFSHFRQLVLSSTSSSLARVASLKLKTFIVCRIVFPWSLLLHIHIHLDTQITCYISLDSPHCNHSCARVCTLNNRNTRNTKESNRVSEYVYIFGTMASVSSSSISLSHSLSFFVFSFLPFLPMPHFSHSLSFFSYPLASHLLASLLAFLHLGSLARSFSGS
ncbi:hypothetical protein K474DRAFT_1124973 [Panus rudis PR-1116 ss-1]|nr:hypothetical protein K474DRAFT_1124973 [Panus rudis PR-1116 ss-1]